MRGIEGLCRGSASRAFTNETVLSDRMGVASLISAGSPWMVCGDTVSAIFTH